MSEPIPHAHAGHPAAFLTKKAGPLPVYLYVVIVVAGLYIYKAYKNRATGTASLNTSASPVTDPTVGSGSGATILPNGTGTVNQAGASETNAQWANRVANGLATSAFSPATVSQALNDYLAGNQLSPAEQAVITQAVLEFGYPPQGVLPILSKPVTPPVATPAPVVSKPIPQPVKNPVAAKKPIPVKPSPPKVAPKPVVASHIYTVHAGDNLTLISEHFYGNASGVSKIFAANRNQISNPNLIYPGQRLVIPA